MAMDSPYTQVTCRLFTTVPEVWESMLDDCSKAERFIYFEQYIFTADAAGTKFLEIFKEKARQGVVVRVLLDTVGSWSLYRSTRILDELKKAGVEVRWYNRVAPLLLYKAASYFFRNHRKLLIVDNTVAHLGGLGVKASMATWRDTHGRLIGPVVAAMAQSFSELWRKNKRSLPHVLGRPRTSVGSGGDMYQFLPNSPARGKRFLYHAMRSAIRRARYRVWITVPYFIPDLGLFRVLQRAAKQGVDVKIILPHASDLPVLDTAGRSYFGMALRAGIKVYTYNASVLHAKVTICDDAWATFGSMNWDSMSFRYNLEGNIVVSNKTTVAELAAHFTEDIEHSKPITLPDWERRPLRSRFFEALLWPFHGLL